VIFTEKIIEIKNVSKHYKMGDEVIVALDDVSLDIEQGEVCLILGPSGSGKSTLLNLIAGLEKPTKGSIKIKGALISKMNERKLAKFRQQYIGFVFQSYNLISTLTALENVTLPLIFSKVPKRVRSKQAFKILKEVGLAKRWRHKPAQMSGGQQQRVSIARAFVNNPAVVFADEPTGNLDTKTSEVMMGLMLKMAKEHNQTVIIVSHDLDTIKFAGKIIRIRDGYVESIEINENAYQVPEAAEEEKDTEEITGVTEAEETNEIEEVAGGKS